MPGAVARRLQALEATRTARALEDFRAAFHAWLEGPCGVDDSETPEEAEARVAAMRAALSPAELALSERLEAALEALVEPATTAANEEEFGVGPGAPPYLALEALAAHFRRPGTD